MGAGIEMLIAVVGCAILATLGAWSLGRSMAGGARFQPSEPDPWPVGVQEDDDVRWNWGER